MAGPRRGPFRDEAIDRLSSPERLDQLLTEVDRRSWIPLAACGALVLGSTCWAVFARVPLHVEGRGILVRPRGVVEFQAPGSGYLARLAVRVGDEVRRGDVLVEIDRPDIEQQLELARDKLAQLTALQRTAEILRSGSAEGASGAASGTGDHLERTRVLAEAIRSEEVAVLEEDRERLAAQLEAARTLALSLEKRFTNQRALRDQGLISEQELLDEEGAWLDATTRVAALATELAGVRPRRLEVEDRYLDRLQRIADFGLELQDYDQQLAETRRELSRLELRLRQEGRVIAEHDASVLEVNVSAGQFLQPGQRLGTLDVHRADASLMGLTYFTVGDGKRIDPDFSRVIRVTPDTVERERYGGIEGEIEAVSDFPVSVEHVESVIGSRELAQSLVDAGYRIEVVARLLPAETPSGLAWSSSRGPEHGVSAGTTTSARVRVERRRPITFVLPYLRTLFGID